MFLVIIEPIIDYLDKLDVTGAAVIAEGNEINYEGENGSALMKIHVQD